MSGRDLTMHCGNTEEKSKRRLLLCDKQCIGIQLPWCRVKKSAIRSQVSFVFLSIAESPLSTPVVLKYLRKIKKPRECSDGTPI